MPYIWLVLLVYGCLSDSIYVIVASNVLFVFYYYLIKLFEDTRTDAEKLTSDIAWLIAFDEFNT